MEVVNCQNNPPTVQMKLSEVVYYQNNPPTNWLYKSHYYWLMHKQYSVYLLSNYKIFRGCLLFTF